MFYWDQYYLIDSKDYFKISFLLTVFLTWLSPEAKLPTRQNYDIRRKTSIRKYTKSGYFFLLGKETKIIRLLVYSPRKQIHAFIYIFSCGKQDIQLSKSEHMQIQERY